jgi:hypothetical protein
MVIIHSITQEMNVLLLIFVIIHYLYTNIYIQKRNPHQNSVKNPQAPISKHVICIITFYVFEKCNNTQQKRFINLNTLFLKLFKFQQKAAV